MSILEHIPVVAIVRQGAKVINKLSDGKLDGVVKEIENFSNSAGYNHMRLENFRDSVYATWDDHKDEVFDLLHSAGETISDGLDQVGEVLSSAAEVIAENLPDLLG